MLQVPELTDADVEAAIKRTFVNATRKHTILAIYGQGTESVVEGVKIIPVSSEFELREGLIVRQRNHFDFWRWSRQALGPAGMFLGWTPLLRAKVRAKAARSLERSMREG